METNYSAKKIKKITKIRGSKLYHVYIQKNENVSLKYIAKIIPLIQNGVTISNIAPFFTEFLINTTLRSEDCMKCEHFIFDHNYLYLLFNEAIGDRRTKTTNFEKTKSQIISLVRAVKHLHSRRIIHGDIKPSNILVFENERVKLADFGNSAFILNGDKSLFSKKMFTKNYRPLEVWENDEWGFASDIWALGCTIFYMVYGVDLFPVQLNNQNYINNLKMWEQDAISLIQNAVSVTKYYDSDYFNINCMIMRMLTPDSSLRPSIFDIEIDLREDFTPSSLFGTTPDSVCRYIDIDDCDHILKCKFNRSYIVADFIEFLNSALSNETNEYGDLVIMIYNHLSNSIEFDLKTLRVSEIIAHGLVAKRIDKFIIDNKHVEAIKNYFCSGGYGFFDWYSFFGVDG